MRSQRANLLAAFTSDLSMGSAQVQKNWLDTGVFYTDPFKNTLITSIITFLTGNSEIGTDPMRTDLIFHVSPESTPKTGSSSRFFGF